MSEAATDAARADRPTTPELSPAASLPLLLVLGVAVLGLVALVFAQITGFDFIIWDDPINVYQNPFLHPVTGANIARFWRAAYYELYTPVMYTFWALCALIAEPKEPVPGLPNPSAHVFHTASLILHSVNTLLAWRLLYFVLKRLGGTKVGGTKTAIASAAGAALFAVHPLQVQSVAWVTGTNNLLSGLFTLLALLAYLSARAPDAKRPALGLTLATVAYVLALLAKPMAVSTALMAVVLDWGIRATDATRSARDDKPTWQREWYKTLWLPAVWVGLAVVDALITRSSSTISHKAFIPLWGRPFVAGSALAFYAEKVIAPLGLSVDYPRPPDVVLGSWWAYADTLGVLAVAALLWWKGSRVMQMAALLFVVALLPALGFVPFYLHLLSTVADRYAYLALLGPALLIAYAGRFGMERFSRAWQIGLIACFALVLMMWSVQTYRETAPWRVTETLYRHTLAVNPRSTHATIALGDALLRKGDPDAAAEAYERAIRYSPQTAEGYADLGAVKLFRGQTDEAITLFHQAIRLYPAGAPARRNLALALELKGDWDGAIEQLQAAIEREPTYAVAREDLAEAQRRAATDRTPLIRKPPQENPVAGPANNEGIRLAQQGDFEAAIRAFRQAIAVRPDYAEAFINLGLTYDQQGNLAEAERALRSALLRQPHSADAHYHLGRVLLRQNKPTDARAEWEAALRDRADWTLPAQALADLDKATTP